ncbi:hypothetical protein Tco_0161806 [Tanacetum coccineum]
MDISDNDDKRDDDDAAGFGVFVYNKAQELSKFTPFRFVVTCSSMEDFTNLLNDPPKKELTDLLSKPVFTNAQTTSVVSNPEGNPEVLSYLSGASKVPFGTYVDVQATNFVMQEMFLGDVVHQESSTLVNTTHNSVTNPQQKSLQEKAKKLMAKAKQSKQKSNFKHINLVTTPSPTTADDLSEMDLKLKLLNKMCKKKSFESHDTHHKIYDLLYEFICLHQESLDAQDTGPSFKKGLTTIMILPMIVRGRKERKKRKDVGQPSSRSLKKNKAPMDSIQKYIPGEQPQDQEEEHEDHILRLSTVVVDKMIKELIKKDELTVTDLEGVGLEMLKRQYKNDVELECHVEQLKALSYEGSIVD